MTWTWDVATALTDPDLAEDVAHGWATREAAEAWMKDMFADLLDDGVHQATLLHDGAIDYAMSLDQ
ncbi:MAG: hypothetical protein LBV06_09045 [Propionibacteriaceae bacterium]|jgi:hypothetical protein|nr:hypothetical protein [Propionibacteriaceae bacterium]